MDKPNPFEASEADRNKGLVKRAAFTARNREVDLVGRIHVDIQNRYLLIEVNTKAS